MRRRPYRISERRVRESRVVQRRVELHEHGNSDQGCLLILTCRQLGQPCTCAGSRVVAAPCSTLLVPLGGTGAKATNTMAIAIDLGCCEAACLLRHSIAHAVAVVHLVRGQQAVKQDSAFCYVLCPRRSNVSASRFLTRAARCRVSRTALFCSSDGRVG